MSYTFFTDRDLGKHLFPNALAAGGLTVERHAAHFDETCPDEEWLAEVGKKGWIAISRDRRIRYKPNEKQAVIRNGVSLLVLVGKGAIPELAQNFIATLPQIETFLAANKPPVIGKVYRPPPADLAKNPVAPGRVDRWYP